MPENKRRHHFRDSNSEYTIEASWEGEEIPTSLRLYSRRGLAGVFWVEFKSIDEFFEIVDKMRDFYENNDNSPKRRSNVQN